MRPFHPGPTSWSRPVRSVHWLVAIGVLVNLFNDTGQTHRIIGYVCLGLVGIRLLHALLTHHEGERLQWPGMNKLRLHFRHLMARQPEIVPGHNPAGQYAVYAMWLLIALLALTGWLSRTDAYWGEDWPVDIHAGLSDALLGMVLLHLLAVVGMTWRLKQDLISSMIRSKRQ